MTQALALCATTLAWALSLGLTAITLTIVGGLDGTHESSEPADCLLVFGAAVHGQATAGPALRRRVDTAVNLYRQGRARTLVMMGGRGSPEQDSEAAVMRRVAIDAGVRPGAILIEETSHSTAENLRNSLPLLREHCDTSLGVSDSYHLARTALVAHSLGLQYSSTPVVAPVQLSFFTMSMLREIIAYSLYSLAISTDTLTLTIDAGFMKA
jgi:uncharacterized SAM-binding protein YcdF (DUF218 family)